MRRLMFTLALLLVASCASAQTVNNPTKVEFTPSIDHSVITSYEIGWFLTGATSPVSTTDLGKPAPDGATGVCTANINVQPLAFESYTAQMRGKAGTMVGEWSLPSNQFQRVPGKPGKPVPK